MILRISHSKFDFNLVDTSFSIIEEYNWFKDGFFSSYSYNISYALSEDEEAALNFITDFYSRGYETIYDVFFTKQFKVFDAVFEVDSIQGRVITFKIYYGLEQFPNFQKKLALLPLHNFAITSGDIYDHAETIVTQTYPAVDYNFPSIFTDSLDTETDKWQAFLGRINNYTGGNFLENSYDVIKDLQINQNVLQPVPYVLYLLKVGFEDAGYTLAGDILQDPLLKKTTLFNLSKYYTSANNTNQQVLQINQDDFQEDLGNNTGLYQETLTFTEPGRYLVSGNLYIRDPNPLDTLIMAARFFVDDVLLQSYFWANIEKLFFVDFTFEILPGQTPATFKFISPQAMTLPVDGVIETSLPILDISVSQLVRYAADGSAIPTLLAPNIIDLTKCVADITFGELFNFFNLAKGYEVTIEGSTIFANKIKDKIGKDPVTSLENSLVKEPRIEINKTKSFELKYSQQDTEDYNFPSLLITGQGVESSPYIVPKDVSSISLIAVPLPLKTVGSITTAHSFLDDDNKMQLVIYNGLVGGINITASAHLYSVVNLYEIDLKPLYDFRLNGNTYKWNFKSSDLDVLKLSPTQTVFAYGQTHVIKKLTQKNETKDVVNTEIETQSI